MLRPPPPRCIMTRPPPRWIMTRPPPRWPCQPKPRRMRSRIDRCRVRSSRRCRSRARPLRSCRFGRSRLPAIHSASRWRETLRASWRRWAIPAAAITRALRIIFYPPLRFDFRLIAIWASYATRLTGGCKIDPIAAVFSHGHPHSEIDRQCGCPMRRQRCDLPGRVHAGLNREQGCGSGVPVLGPAPRMSVEI